MAELIPIGDFESCLTDLCTKEVMNAETTLNEVISKRAAALKRKLIERSPENTGAYKKGWRIRTAMRNHEKVKIIYNADRPDLTFMLEYGTMNEDGSKRMPAKQHIRGALNEEIDQMIEELVNRL